MLWIICIIWIWILMCSDERKFILVSNSRMVQWWMNAFKAILVNLGRCIRICWQIYYTWSIIREMYRVVTDDFPACHDPIRKVCVCEAFQQQLTTIINHRRNGWETAFHPFLQWFMDDFCNDLCNDFIHFCKEWFRKDSFFRFRWSLKNLGSKLLSLY